MYLCFSSSLSSSSASPCSSSAQMSWDFYSREGHGLGGDLGDEDLGCMRTRCRGFHEAGEGQRQRGLQRTEEGAWLFSITLINGGGVLGDIGQCE